MVCVSFFEVSCQSCVSFSRCAGCDSRWVNNVVCKALSFRGDIVLSFCNCIFSCVPWQASTCNLRGLSCYVTR